MSFRVIDWVAEPSGQSVTASLGGTEITGHQIEVNISDLSVLSVQFCISLSLSLTLRIEQSLDSGSTWNTLQDVSLVAASGGRTYWSGWHTLSGSEASNDCLLRPMLVGIGSATVYYIALAGS